MAVCESSAWMMCLVFTLFSKELGLVDEVAPSGLPFITAHDALAPENNCQCMVQRRGPGRLFTFPAQHGYLHIRPDISLGYKSENMAFPD
jgi:hypothetical protein